MHALPDVALVQNVIATLHIPNITEDDLCLKLYQTILHLLTHVLLPTTAVTSGFQLDDLDYLVKAESGESWYSTPSARATC